MIVRLKKLNAAKCISKNGRDGISVIEVITAMLVALIGVFGVLVLIPFSVQQAQIGLDQDAAGLLAENAIEDIKIMGLASVGPVAGQPNNVTQMRFRGARISLDTTSGAPLVVSSAVVNTGSNLRISTPTIFHFDPIAVSNVGFPVTAPIVGNADCFNTVLRNPDFLTSNLPSDITGNRLRIPVVTATSQFQFAPPNSAALLGRQESERIFRNHDDIILHDVEEGGSNALGSAVDELDIPQLLYDVNSTGNLVRTQTNGRISWSAVFVPQKPNRVNPQFSIDPSASPLVPLPVTQPNRFKVYVLVYKDRSVDPTDAESQMLAGRVARHPYGTVLPNTIGGFTNAVDRIPIDPLFPVDDSVNKDDWVMLINRRPTPYYPDVHTAGPVQTAGLRMSYDTDLTTLPPRFVADEAGYDIQVAFAKIRSLNGQTLFVEGGPFDFYYSNVAGGQFGINAAGGPDATYSSDTYVVHLRNVVTVYERTITLEKNSTWN